MKPDEIVVRTVNRLRRRALVRTKALKVLDWLYWGLAGLAIYTAVIRFSGRFALDHELVLSVVLVSLLVGFLKASGLKVDTSRVVAEVDRKFALHERLSTARELLQGSARSGLEELQVSDAAAHVQRLNLQSFGPGPAIRWRLRYSLLTAAYVALFLLAQDTGLHGKRAVSPKDLKGEGYLLETARGRSGRSSVAETASLERGVGKGYFEKGERGGDEGVEGVEEGLRSESGIRLNTGSLSMLQGEKLPDLRKFGEEELLRFAQGIIENRPRPLGGEQFDLLKEAWERGDAAALRELLEKLSDGQKRAAGGVVSSSAEAGRQEDEPLSSRADDHVRESFSAKNRKEGRAGFAPASGLDSMFEEAEESGGGRMRPGGRQPGEERGQEYGAASALSGYRGGRASRVRGKMDRGEVLQGLVKALPVRNPSAVKPQEVIVQYRNEAEGIMEKYDFPPHYREYIRRYFLAIGMSKESEDRQ